jgi:hypothetical protein
VTGTDLVASPVGRGLVQALLLEDVTLEQLSGSGTGGLSDPDLYRMAVQSGLDVSSEGVEAALADAEPDGDADRAAAMADAVVHAPSARWWSGDWNERDQVWLSSPGLRTGRGVGRPAEGKPPVELWTSSVVEGMPSAWWPVMTSGLIAGVTDVHVWRVSAAPDVRVFEIRKPEDWRRLCEQFPGFSRAVPPAGPGRRSSGAATVVVEPDWRAVSREFDAVHLTAAGLVTAQGVATPLDGGVALLWGWDAESTAWLTPAIRDLRFVGALELEPSE